MDESRSASTPATSISSWDRVREVRPCRSACSSMENLPALLTASTSTNRATERCPNSGSTSLFANGDQSPTAHSRSPSSLPTSRPTRSRSARPPAHFLGRGTEVDGSNPSEGVAPDSVYSVKVTAEAARRFLVARQMLAPARSLDGGPDAVLEVFRRLGSIQFDPLSVAGRNHDLVLHARVADYDPAWCDLLYERREIFEAYNKGLSLVPTSEFPWFRWTTWSRGSRARPCRKRRGGRVGARPDPRRGSALVA